MECSDDAEKNGERNGEQYG
jgi:hypothetical protein